MGFSRQEYWSGLPFPTPADHPHPGIKPAHLASPALTGGFFTTSATWEAGVSIIMNLAGEVGAWGGDWFCTSRKKLAVGNQTVHLKGGRKTRKEKQKKGEIQDFKLVCAD